jgi:glutamate N-acetyltransferase/amino-acid N-acetyltransferase
VNIGGKTVSIGGHCKGSGMIHPNMATMLGVVSCDAAVESEAWRGMVKRASMASFNQASVECCDEIQFLTQYLNIFHLVRRDPITMLFRGPCAFPQITVDGDTSTNDCVIGLASGAAGNAVITDAGTADGKKLEAALTALLQGLAKSIAWDGEGATCLMEISVVGAKTDADARKVDR